MNLLPRTSLIPAVLQRCLFCKCRHLSSRLDDRHACGLKDSSRDKQSIVVNLLDVMCWLRNTFWESLKVTSSAARALCLCFIDSFLHKGVERWKCKRSCYWPAEPRIDRPKAPERWNLLHWTPHSVIKLAVLTFMMSVWLNVFFLNLSVGLLDWTWPSATGWLQVLYSVVQWEDEDPENSQMQLSTFVANDMFELHWGSSGVWRVCTVCESFPEC